MNEIDKRISKYETSINKWFSFRGFSQNRRKRKNYRLKKYTLLKGKQFIK